MMDRLFPLCVLVCASATATAQVKLTVREKKTGDPLPGVAILWSQDKKMVAPRRAVTDNNGTATLSTGGGKTWYYRLTCIGYKKKEGSLTDTDKELTVTMDEDAQQLGEVTVTGEQTSRPVKITPVQTQVLNARKLVEAGYGSLDAALRQETPGLTIQKVGFGNEVSMQGLDARHVLFLMDGERMTGEMAGNLDYERFNLHALDHIEIVKGASSTLYGSHASGAVINLITKKTTKPLDITAGGRWGMYNERNYKHPQKDDFLYMYEKNADTPNLQGWVSAGFKAGAFTSQTDLWASSTDAFYIYSKTNDKKVYPTDVNPFLTKDVIVESSLPRPPMGVEGEEHVSLSQKLYFVPSKHLKAEVYGSLFYMNMYDLVQDLSFTQTKDYTWGAKLSYTFKDWFTVTAGFHEDLYDRYKRHERRDEQKKVYAARIMQPRLTVTSNYFRDHALIFGVEHTDDALTSNRFSGKGNLRMLTRSLVETEYFLQDDWTMNEMMEWSIGVRTNFSKQFGFMWMPKVALKATPVEHWTFRANYSMGYRSPSIKELFFNWDHLGMFMIRGNEYLKPEKNNYFSLGAEYEDDRFFINANVYANLFRKKIEGVWKIYDMQYNFEYTNLGHQNLIGGEIIARWNFLPHWTLNASYSYVNVEKTKDAEGRELRLNSTSPHAATGSLEYRMYKKNYSLTARFSTSMMSKKQFDVQDRLRINGEQSSREAYFRCTLPAYALCNLSVSQTFGPLVRLVIGCDNVFNYKPKTTGAGLTAFNVPATAGARGYIQAELKLDEVLNLFKKKK